MFTLKFVRVGRSVDDEGGAYVISAARYGVRSVPAKDGHFPAKVIDLITADQMTPNESFTISHGVGDWARCYVMSESGATVDKIMAPDVEPVAA
jgi:hypothetical protein